VWENCDLHTDCIILARNSDNDSDKVSLYSVSRKKETKNVFFNIVYKTLAILMEFGTQFPG